MASDEVANSKEFSKLIKFTRAEENKKSTKINFEGISYCGEEINSGLEKYFIKVLAKAHQHETLDELHFLCLNFSCI